MSLRSKTFLVRKGEGIDDLTLFLRNTIGLDAYLIKSIAATALNDTVTQLTLIYQEYPDFIIDSYAPRPGAIIPTGVITNWFDSRILFNTAVDVNSIQSGSFLIDDVGIDTSRVSVSDSYYVKLNLSGYGTSGFHEIRLDSTKLKKIDGTSFEYSPVGGYVVNSLAGSHIGDKLDPYYTRRRGLVKADIVKPTKGTSPQQCIEEYLSQRGLEKEKLLAYTFASRNNNIVEVFFIYIDKLEPQIIEGYPLTNTVVPNESSLDSVTLVFTTKLDKAHLTSTDGLFTIESDWITSTPIEGQHITVENDLRTVRIDLSTYITADRVYSIVARPGIKSLDGVLKQKPEQWVLHLSEYRGVIGGATVTGELTTGAPLEAQYLLGTPNVLLTNGLVVTGLSGITITPGPGYARFSLSGNLYPDITNHLVSTGNPHSTTYAQVGAPSLSAFTGHTGDPSIHYTVGSISHTSIQDIGVYTHDEIDTHINDVSNPHGVTYTQVGAPSLASFTGHTGLTGIHFTQSQISIPASQIYNFNTAVSDYVSTLSGVSNATFGLHTGNTGIHFTVASISHNDIQDRGVNSHTTIDSHLSSTSNPHSVTYSQVGSPSLAQFTGHTGNNTLHFAQSEISITTNQISDFSGSVQDIIGEGYFFSFATGVTGSYNTSNNTYNIKGVYATATTHGVAKFNSSYFSVSSGEVNFNGIHISSLQGVSLGELVAGQYLTYNGTDWVNTTFTMSETPIEALQNVEVTDPTSQNLMTYNTVTSQWENYSISGGGNVVVTQNNSNKSLLISGSFASLDDFTGHTGDSTIHFTQSQISDLTGHSHFIAYSGVPPIEYHRSGMSWLDTSTARYYIWYIDPDSSQWIEIQ